MPRLPLLRRSAADPGVVIGDGTGRDYPRPPGAHPGAGRWQPPAASLPDAGLVDELRHQLAAKDRLIAQLEAALKDASGPLLSVAHCSADRHLVAAIAGDRDRLEVVSDRLRARVAELERAVCALRELTVHCAGHDGASAP